MKELFDKAIKKADTVKVHDSKYLIENTIRKQYSDYGYGRWAVIEKASGEFTGWCGLKLMSENNEIDLGYRFQKKFWGKSFATEAAMASLKFGFEIKKLERIIGRAMTANIASIKVLEKCGMKFCKADLLHGEEGVVYEIFNSNK